MKVSGLMVASVSMTSDGKWEVVVRFETQEQAARFQSLAYQIGMFADCDHEEREQEPDDPLAEEPTEDQFMEGIAKTQEEAGFGVVKPPSEAQVKLANLISKKLIIALPTEKSARAYWSFIKEHKDEFDRQVQAENNGRR